MRVSGKGGSHGRSTVDKGFKGFGFREGLGTVYTDILIHLMASKLFSDTWL